MFVTTDDNVLWHVWQKEAGGAWGNWASEGGPVSGDLAVGRDDDGRLQVVGLAPDRTIVRTGQVK